jgi:hypothetical protein
VPCPGWISSTSTSGASPCGSWNVRRRKGRSNIAASARQIAYIIRRDTCAYVDERATRAGAVEAALRHRDGASTKHQVTINDPPAKAQ